MAEVRAAQASANGARHFQPGASPQVLRYHEETSAESAIHESGFQPSASGACIYLGRWPRLGMRRAFGPGILIFVAWLVAVISPLRAQTASAEYQLKAVFLFNFTQFVEWPSSAFADPEGPLVIGVLGADPFGARLDEAVQGEKINGHPLAVRRYRSVAEVGACHVLFICSSEKARLRDILARLRGRSILTVSDLEDFTPEGGVIRFMTERNRIKLRVNLGAAKAAGLTISSKLLRAAEVVEQRPN